MGAAKRRGTFEQRKAQRLSEQFGMSNEELAEAYYMNRIYYRRFAKKSIFDVNCEQGSDKVVGYCGFLTSFELDEKGNFIEMGAYE